MSKHSFIIISFFIFWLSSNIVGADTTNFIKIKFGRFSDGDKPWFANGGNCTYDGRLNKWSNEDIESWFKIASENGMNAMRIFACGEGLTSNDSIRENGRVYQLGAPGNWYEPAFRSTDFALFCARKYNIRILFTLVTHTQGSQTYGAWAGIDMGEFWSNATCKQWYKNYVNYIVNRTNIYTGIKYKDDPYIFGWEPGNEVDISNFSNGSAVSRGILDNWIWEMAAYIKSVAPNQLVGSGIQGGYELRTTSNSATSKWKISHNNPNIDFCSFHNYPLEASPNQSRADCEPIMLNAIKFSRELNKPVLMGEFGVSDQTTSSKGYTTTEKKEIWWKYFGNYTAGFQMGGQLFWCWYKPNTNNGGSGVNPQTAVHAGLRNITKIIGDSLDKQSTGMITYDSRPKAITNLRASVTNQAKTVTFSWDQPVYSNGAIPDENYPLTFELRYDNMDDYVDVVSNTTTKNRTGYCFGEMRYTQYFTLPKGINTFSFTSTLVSDGIIPNEYYLRFRDSKENVWSELSNKPFVTSAAVAPTIVQEIRVSDKKISVDNGRLSIESPTEPVVCTVYNIFGRLVFSENAKYSHEIILPQKGIFVIDLGTEKHKIISH